MYILTQIERQIDRGRSSTNLATFQSSKGKENLGHVLLLKVIAKNTCLS